MRRYGIICHEIVRQTYRDEYEELLDALHQNYSDFGIEGAEALRAGVIYEEAVKIAERLGLQKIGRTVYLAKT